jgi:hypothetical protein
MLWIQFKPAYLSHHAYISSVRFISVRLIVASQAIVLIKSDPLRPAGMQVRPSVESAMHERSNWWNGHVVLYGHLADRRSL